MKTAFVLLLSAVVATAIEDHLNSEQKAQGEQIAKYCMQQFEIGSQEFASLQSGDLSNINQTVKCFGNCILEQLGILRGGVLQEQVAQQKLSEVYDPERAKELIKACRGVQGTDPCDTAFKLYECYLNNKQIVE